VLQSALFPYISVAGATPNLMLILTVSFGLMRGRKEGMLVGFFCGFLYDLYLFLLMVMKPLCKATDNTIDKEYFL